MLEKFKIHSKTMPQACQNHPQITQNSEFISKSFQQHLKIIPKSYQTNSRHIPKSFKQH